jgi:diaminopimelate decarboxylase
MVAGNIVIFSGLGNPVTGVRPGPAPQKVWENKEVGMYMNSPVMAAGMVWGLSHRNKGQFFGLDPTSGKTVWTSEGRQTENAAMLASGQTVFALTTESELSVYAASAKGLQHLRRYHVGRYADLGSSGRARQPRAGQRRELAHFVECRVVAFKYLSGTYYCDGTPLPAIAQEAGTPCYVYSAGDILSRYRAYDEAFGDLPHRVCYAVKRTPTRMCCACSRMRARGSTSFQAASCTASCKREAMRVKSSSPVSARLSKKFGYALAENIHIFNCESEPELAVIDAVAGRAGKRAKVAFRVNPDVDAATHPYISTGMSDHKFGIDIAEVEAVYARAMWLPNVNVEGVSCHIGSQILDANPLLDAVDKMIALVDRLRAGGVPIRHLDLGGGIGVPYRPADSAPEIPDVIGAIRSRVVGRDLHVSVEPGRSIAGEAGVLLTRLLYKKQTARKQFLVVDAAMNDLIRPALYKSHHEIVPVTKHDTREIVTVDVVGPVCETGDFLARDRDMDVVEPGELLAICTAGAYGFAQSSNYNSRVRAAEVLVTGDEWRVIRRRETYEDLVRGE